MIARRKPRPQDIIFGSGILDSLLEKFTFQRFPGERHAREGLIGRPYNFAGKMLA